MKKRNFYKISAIVIVAIFSIVTITLTTNNNKYMAYSLTKGNLENEIKEQNTLKDETIYGILSSNGDVDSIYAVNHLYVPKDGVYTDYGDYSNITSLTNDTDPTVSDNTIKWNLKESFNGFYYKGNLKSKKLPWDFNITYILDGKEISPEYLAGKSGTIDIIISVAQNKNSIDYFNNNYGIQVQVPINLNNSKIISEEGSTKVITGKTATLAYTVLPGTSGTYKATLESKNFEMDGINISITPMDISSMADTSEFTKGFNSLSNGMEELINGTSKLKNGTSQLTNGIDELTQGQQKLVNNSSSIINGMKEYGNGIEKLNSSVTQLEGGSTEFNKGLSQISNEGNNLVTGYKKMADSIKSQLPSEEEKSNLKALVKYTNSSNPQEVQLGKMATSMLKQIEGTEKLYNSLNTLNEGLTKYNGGISNMANEYKNIHGGIAKLSTGTNELYNNYDSILQGNQQFVTGLSDIHNGMVKLNQQAKVLPDSVEKLIDGEKKIKNGIDEANRSISEMMGKKEKDKKIVSFVSPNNKNINSVQFILRTPNITIAEKEVKINTEEKEKKNFFEKLIDLF